MVVDKNTVRWRGNISHHPQGRSFFTENKKGPESGEKKIYTDKCYTVLKSGEPNFSFTWRFDLVSNERSPLCPAFGV